MIFTFPSPKKKWQLPYLTDLNIKVTKQSNQLWEGQQLEVLKESPVLSAALHTNVSRAPQLSPSPHSCATLLTVLLKAFVEIKGLLGLSLKWLLLASSFQETALTIYQQVLLSSLLMASFDLTWTLLQVLKQLLKHSQQSQCYFLFSYTRRHSLCS